jgi:hypothetical protein
LPLILFIAITIIHLPLPYTAYHLSFWSLIHLGVSKKRLKIERRKKKYLSVVRKVLVGGFHIFGSILGER